MAKRPATSGSFKKGQSGNPGGRPKILAEVRDLARSHTEESVKALVRVMRNKKAPPAATVAASTAILDRGWGKPTQYVEAGQNPLDGLTVDEQRALLEALDALPDNEGDAAQGTGSTHH